MGCRAEKQDKRKSEYRSVPYRRFRATYQVSFDASYLSLHASDCSSESVVYDRRRWHSNFFSARVHLLHVDHCFKVYSIDFYTSAEAIQCSGRAELNAESNEKPIMMKAVSKFNNDCLRKD